jgi:hypothetical protein
MIPVCIELTASQHQAPGSLPFQGHPRHRVLPSRLHRLPPHGRRRAYPQQDLRSKGKNPCTSAVSLHQEPYNDISLLIISLQAEVGNPARHQRRSEKHHPVTHRKQPRSARLGALVRGDGGAEQSEGSLQGLWRWVPAHQGFLRRRRVSLSSFLTMARVPC